MNYGPVMIICRRRAKQRISMRFPTGAGDRRWNGSPLHLPLSDPRLGGVKGERDGRGDPALHEKTRTRVHESDQQPGSQRCAETVFEFPLARTGLWMESRENASQSRYYALRLVAIMGGI